MTELVGSENTGIEVLAQWVGADLVVTIGGGTRPHVGAVAVAQPRPSLKGDGGISASASVITLLGHKEDELVRWAALYLASQLNTNVVVAAGIHLDGATLDEIQQIDAEVRRRVAAMVE